MTKRSKKYKKKLKKYQKTAKKYVNGGVKIWNKLNTPKNKKKMVKLGLKAYQMQQSLLQNL
jgi:hypothetical protein